jgi:hypothetical protein
MAECFFRNRPEFAKNPGSTNEPWRFYPEQWEVAEYDGDILLAGGAGTGKTRNFAAKGLWVPAFARASVLVVTHSDVARGQIFEEMLYQIEHSDFLSRIYPPRSIKHGNVRKIIGPYGTVRFVLSGNGHSVFGVQIGRGGYLILDEAALYKNRAWAAILSRARAGCRILAGSVPYGKRGNKFEQLVRTAIPLETARLRDVRRLDQDVDEEEDVSFAYVNWNRETQPGWSAREKAKAIRAHREPDGWEYRVYVRGELADPEGQVFPTSEIDRIFVRVPHYRCLRLVWDAQAGVVKCSTSASMDTIGVGTSARMRRMSDEAHRVETFDIVDWTARNLPSAPYDVLGLDAGRLQDPSELLGAEDTGHGLRVRWRIQMMHVPYPVQGRLCAALLSGRVLRPARLGLGIEASGGNLATSIWEWMTGRDGGVGPEKISPYNWSTSVVLYREDGAARRTASRHEVKRTLKHHLTLEIKKLIEVQGKGKGCFELPLDDTMRIEWQQHAGVHHERDFKYDDENDHTIEAARVMVGRYVEQKQVGTGPILRARTASIERISIPRSARGKV